MSIFEKRRIDLKIQYIIIIIIIPDIQRNGAEWLFLFILLHEQKSSIKVRTSDAR
jgi:hypothetical protein